MARGAHPRRARRRFLRLQGGRRRLDVIEEGELRVLLGANGAGKTTLMDLISGRTREHGRPRVPVRPGHHQPGGAPHRARRARPQVPDPERLQGTSRSAAISRSRAARAAACSPTSASAFPAAPRAGRRGARPRPALSRCRRDAAAAQSQPRPDAMARARPAHRAEPQGAAARRADRRHDGRPRRRRRRDHQGPEGAPHASSSSSTTWPSCARSPSASRSCISARSSPRATSPTIENDPKVRRGLSRLARRHRTDARAARRRQLLRPQPHPARRLAGRADEQITAVLGRNGTGKTTLLKTLMGLTDRMTGPIELRRRGHRPRARPICAPAPASPTCRRAARSSPTSPCARTS